MCRASPSAPRPSPSTSSNVYGITDQCALRRRPLGEIPSGYFPHMYVCGETRRSVMSVSARATPMSTVPRRQLRGLPQGLCPFPCAAPPRRRASCRLCPRCRLCPLCLSLRHLCVCLSAADDDNAHAALPNHTAPDAGQARYYDSSRRQRGRSAVHGGRVVVVLSPSLSPSVGGGGTLSRRLCRRAVCRRQPFPPHSLGCRSVLCGRSGSAPSLHPRGARGGMCGEQPTCRLALGGTHRTAGSELALSVGAHFGVPHGLTGQPSICHLPLHVL